MAAEDKALTRERLKDLRRQWLQKHDQDTAGIPGLFPAMKEMPVRFTATLDRQRQIFKHTRGQVVGWQLDALDLQRSHGACEAEFVCEKTPQLLFVRIAKAEWTIREAWSEGVYVLKLACRPWIRDRAARSRCAGSDSSSCQISAARPIATAARRWRRSSRTYFPST